MITQDGVGSQEKRQLSLRNNPNAVIGVNINDSTQSFTEEILAGEKTVETREAGLNAKHGSMYPYIGKRVAIVRTGNGKATVVGWATIAEEIEYGSEKDFRDDYERHLISEDNSDYYWHDGRKKFGYILEDVVKEENPYVVTERGIVVRDVDRSVQARSGADQYQLRTKTMSTREVLLEAARRVDSSKGTAKFTDAERSALSSCA